MLTLTDFSPTLANYIRDGLAFLLWSMMPTLGAVIGVTAPR